MNIFGRKVKPQEEHMRQEVVSLFKELLWLIISVNDGMRYLL